MHTSTRHRRPVGRVVKIAIVTSGLGSVFSSGAVFAEPNRLPFPEPGQGRVCLNQDFPIWLGTSEAMGWIEGEFPKGTGLVAATVGASDPAVVSPSVSSGSNVVAVQTDTGTSLYWVHDGGIDGAEIDTRGAVTRHLTAVSNPGLIAPGLVRRRLAVARSAESGMLAFENAGDVFLVPLRGLAAAGRPVPFGAGTTPVVRPHRDGFLLAATSTSGVVLRRVSSAAREEWRAIIETEGNHRAFAAAVRPDLTTVAIWSLPTGAELAGLFVSSDGVVGERFHLNLEGASVKDLAISSDGSVAAAIVRRGDNADWRFIRIGLGEFGFDGEPTDVHHSGSRLRWAFVDRFEDSEFMAWTVESRSPGDFRQANFSVRRGDGVTQLRPPARAACRWLPDIASNSGEFLATWIEGSDEGWTLRAGLLEADALKLERMFVVANLSAPVGRSVVAASGKEFVAGAVDTVGSRVVARLYRLSRSSSAEPVELGEIALPASSGSRLAAFRLLDGPEALVTWRTPNSGGEVRGALAGPTSVRALETPIAAGIGVPVDIFAATAPVGAWRDGRWLVLWLDARRDPEDLDLWGAAVDETGVVQRVFEVARGVVIREIEVAATNSGFVVAGRDRNSAQLVVMHLDDRGIGVGSTVTLDGSHVRNGLSVVTLGSTAHLSWTESCGIRTATYEDGGGLTDTGCGASDESSPIGVASAASRSMIVHVADEQLRLLSGTPGFDIGLWQSEDGVRATDDGGLPAESGMCSCGVSNSPKEPGVWICTVLLLRSRRLRRGRPRSRVLLGEAVPTKQSSE